MIKKILVLTFAVSTIIANTYGQTKKIAYKSHSGSTENYATALNENLFDIENSNFGVAPTREVIEAQLDSVIFICDSVAVMVTSRFCKSRYECTNPKAKKNNGVLVEIVFFITLYFQKNIRWIVLSKCYKCTIILKTQLVK